MSDQLEMKARHISTSGRFPDAPMTERVVLLGVSAVTDGETPEATLTVYLPGEDASRCCVRLDRQTIDWLRSELLTASELADVVVDGEPEDDRIPNEIYETGLGSYAAPDGPTEYGIGETGLGSYAAGRAGYEY